MSSCWPSALLSTAWASNMEAFPSWAACILARHRTSTPHHNTTEHEWAGHSAGLFSSPIQKVSDKARCHVMVHFPTMTARGLHDAPEEVTEPVPPETNISNQQLLQVFKS